jgi:hypothetical protein
MVDNNTSIIGLFNGTWQDLYNQFVKNAPLLLVDLGKIERLAKLYIKWGKIFTLRADIAWAQMEHETAFLTYPRRVKEYSNNYAGLGAIEGQYDEDGVPVFAVFKTEELGVIAHIAHLAWYVYSDHVNVYCSYKYDPRHKVFGDKHNYNGDHTLNTLNTRWAPSKTYTAKIITFANQVFPSDELVSPVENLTQKVKNALNISTDYKWKYIAIHHTVSGQFWTTMDKIRQWHLARGFLREGYNFGINGNGEIETGRPLNMQGAHVKYHNTEAVGVALYGDFRTDTLTIEQKKSAYMLCNQIMAGYDIPVKNVLGHGEFTQQATSCPVIDMDKFRKELALYRNGELDL